MKSFQQSNMDIQQLKWETMIRTIQIIWKITDFPLHRVKTFQSTAGKDYVRITNLLILKWKETNRTQFVIQKFCTFESKFQFPSLRKLASELIIYITWTSVVHTHTHIYQIYIMKFQNSTLTFPAPYLAIGNLEILIIHESIDAILKVIKVIDIPD